MGVFDPSLLKRLYRPPSASNGEDNGQVTLIAGSELFHGPPVLALKTISRIVDMVFFASPESALRDVAANLKSSVGAFIWVPWDEVHDYIEKSDAILIGPGFMRFRSEKSDDVGRQLACDEACELSKNVTRELLTKYKDKKWVIDAGALQVMEKEWIPKGAILTPNKKEYRILFDEGEQSEMARKHECVIVLKGAVTKVCSSDKCVDVKGGNAGMTKGGTGDVQAALTVALLAKNEPFLAASAAAYIVKAAADRLYKDVGYYYSADDLAEALPRVVSEYI